MFKKFFLKTGLKLFSKIYRHRKKHDADRYTAGNWLILLGQVDDYETYSECIKLGL